MFRKILLAAVMMIGALGIGAEFTGSARTAANPEKPAGDRAAPFVHCVIFHLKKDAPAGEADLLIADAHEMLRPAEHLDDDDGRDDGEGHENAEPAFQ